MEKRKESRGRYESAAELERKHLPRERHNKFGIGCR